MNPLRKLLRNPIPIVVAVGIATVISGWLATDYIREVIEPNRQAARQVKIAQEIAEADRLYDRGRYKRAQALYRSVLDLHAGEIGPERLSHVWFRTGRCHLEMALENRSMRENLEQADDAFAEALRLRPLASAPVTHAETRLQQGHLARVRLNLDGDPSQLDRALEHYMAALEVFSRKTHPLDYARTQRRIGNVYRDLFARGPERALIPLAENAYQEALETFRERDAVQEFAETSVEKGIAFYEFGAAMAPLGNSKKAIAALRDALEVHKEGNDDAQLRDTYRHLAAAYSLLGKHAKHSSERFHANLESRRAIYLAEGSSDPIKMDQEERSQRIRTTD